MHCATCFQNPSLTPRREAEESKHEPYGCVDADITHKTTQACAVYPSADGMVLLKIGEDSKEEVRGSRAQDTRAETDAETWEFV